MNNIQFEQINYVFADIVAFNNIGMPVLLVEIKPNNFNGDNLSNEKAIEQMIYHLKLADKLIPFAMLVTLKTIQIFEWNGENLSKPIVCLRSADILNYYDAEFTNKRIFRLYLTTLVEAWLRDLAYHWKSQNPPALKELESIGLLEKLADGTTQAEVKIGNDTLH